NGTRLTADNWLKDNIDPYAQWAKAHNSLLIVTWDEGDVTPDEHIPTFYYGAHVVPGRYDETFNHYTTLRTIEDLFGASHANQAGDDSAGTITDVWDTAPASPAPAAPHSTKATVRSSNHIDLSWSDVGDNETLQTVQISTD